MTPPAELQWLEYVIEVDGVVDPRWSEWLSGVDIRLSPADAARTILTARLPDQTALPALLARVTGLNLKILSVTPRAPAGSK
ncbi:MAG TPA: hypothetical protein VFI11_14830 [Anaerolineales bacterium]|nr:hypothetical protein [Anaerolineales bacterium]